MDAIADKLESDLKANLTAIRSALGNLPQIQARSPVDLVEQGNRRIDCFESWLLDDEQIQMLSLQPRHLFILYAAAYLGDIGLTEGNGPAGTDAYRTLYTRSAELIRTNWQNLGITDASLAEIIARVCLLAGNGDSSSRSAIIIDGQAVNVSLLAACLQLATALDLTAPPTLAPRPEWVAYR